MSLKGTVGKDALDLAQNEKVLDKTERVLGLLFPYVGLNKKIVDMYIAEIEKTDMPIEAKMFAMVNAKKTIKKIKNQKQIADIALKNVKEGTLLTSNSNVNEEWLERFMDSAAFVSDENIQLIWGKILSNEFDNPGTTPPNMIRILSEMTPTYAKAFKVLCSMRVLLIYISNDDCIAKKSWNIAVPFNENEEFMDNLGISFEIINELETIGVIKFEPLIGYAEKGENDTKMLVYINGKTMEVTHYDPENVPIGNVILTSAGEALKRITTVDEIENYDEALKKYMSSYGVIFSDEEHYQVIAHADEVQLKKKAL